MSIQSINDFSKKFTASAPFNIRSSTVKNNVVDKVVNVVNFVVYVVVKLSKLSSCVVPVLELRNLES